jgi:predicted TIM-barrel fold metal-dependent hydrolase
MDRRQLLLKSAACAGVAASVCWPGLSAAQSSAPGARAASVNAWRQRLQAILGRGKLPIIDMQATYVAGTSKLDQIIAWMDEVDVAQIAFAPAFSADSEPSLQLHRQYPGHFIPTTSSGEFPRWWNNPLAFVSGIERDLKTGNYFTMGEHEFRHYPSPEQVEARNAARDITIALDGPAGHALFKLSEETGAAFQIHYEIEDPLLPVLEAMLARYPKAQVIWCHLGMIRYPDRSTRYGPAYVKALLSRFPGLHFDLAVPRPENVYRPSGAQDSTLFTNGRLAQSWRSLLEEFPDRFLAASDSRPAVEHLYRTAIGRHRTLILEELSEPARHKIAYANAWRLVTGEVWSEERTKPAAGS